MGPKLLVLALLLYFCIFYFGLTEVILASPNVINQINHLCPKFASSSTRSALNSNRNGGHSSSLGFGNNHGVFNLGRRQPISLRAWHVAPLNAILQGGGGFGGGGGGGHDNNGGGGWNGGGGGNNNDFNPALGHSKEMDMNFYEKIVVPMEKACRSQSWDQHINEKDEFVMEQKTHLCETVEKLNKLFKQLKGEYAKMDTGNKFETKEIEKIDEILQQIFRLLDNDLVNVYNTYDLKASEKVPKNGQRIIGELNGIVKNSKGLDILQTAFNDSLLGLGDVYHDRASEIYIKSGQRFAYKLRNIENTIRANILKETMVQNKLPMEYQLFAVNLALFYSHTIEQHAKSDGQKGELQKFGEKFLKTIAEASAMG